MVQREENGTSITERVYEIGNEVVMERIELVTAEAEAVLPETRTCGNTPEKSLIASSVCSPSVLQRERSEPVVFAYTPHSSEPLLPFSKSFSFSHEDNKAPVSDLSAHDRRKRGRDALHLVTAASPMDEHYFHQLLSGDSDQGSLKNARVEEEAVHVPRTPGFSLDANQEHHVDLGGSRAHSDSEKQDYGINWIEAFKMVPPKPKKPKPVSIETPDQIAQLFGGLPRTEDLLQEAPVSTRTESRVSEPKVKVEPRTSPEPSSDSSPASKPPSLETVSQDSYARLPTAETNISLDEVFAVFDRALDQESSVTEATFSQKTTDQRHLPSLTPVTSPSRKDLFEDSVISPSELANDIDGAEESRVDRAAFQQAVSDSSGCSSAEGTFSLRDTETPEPRGKLTPTKTRMESYLPLDELFSKEKSGLPENSIELDDVFGESTRTPNETQVEISNKCACAACDPERTQFVLEKKEGPRPAEEDRKRSLHLVNECVITLEDIFRDESRGRSAYALESSALHEPRATVSSEDIFYSSNTPQLEETHLKIQGRMEKLDSSREEPNESATNPHILLEHEILPHSLSEPSRLLTEAFSHVPENATQTGEIMFSVHSTSKLMDERESTSLQNSSRALNNVEDNDESILGMIFNRTYGEIEIETDKLEHSASEQKDASLMVPFEKISEDLKIPTLAELTTKSKSNHGYSTEDDILGMVFNHSFGNKATRLNIHNSLSEPVILDYNVSNEKKILSGSYTTTDFAENAPLTPVHSTIDITHETLLSSSHADLGDDDILAMVFDRSSGTEKVTPNSIHNSVSEPFSIDWVVPNEKKMISGSYTKTDLSRKEESNPSDNATDKFHETTPFASHADSSDDGILAMVFQQPFGENDVTKDSYQNIGNEKSLEESFVLNEKITQSNPSKRSSNDESSKASGSSRMDSSNDGIISGSSRMDSSNDGIIELVYTDSIGKSDAATNTVRNAENKTANSDSTVFPEKITQLEGSRMNPTSKVVEATVSKNSDAKNNITSPKTSASINWNSPNDDILAMVFHTNEVRENEVPKEGGHKFASETAISESVGTHYAGSRTRSTAEVAEKPSATHALSTQADTRTGKNSLKNLTASRVETPDDDILAMVFFQKEVSENEVTKERGGSFVTETTNRDLVGTLPVGSKRSATLKVAEAPTSILAESVSYGKNAEAPTSSRFGFTQDEIISMVSNQPSNKNEITTARHQNLDSDSNDSDSIAFREDVMQVMDFKRSSSAEVINTCFGSEDEAVAQIKQVKVIPAISSDASNESSQTNNPNKVLDLVFSPTLVLETEHNPNACFCNACNMGTAEFERATRVVKEVRDPEIRTLEIVDPVEIDLEEVFDPRRTTGKVEKNEEKIISDELSAEQIVELEDINTLEQHNTVRTQTQLVMDIQDPKVTKRAQQRQKTFAKSSPRYIDESAESIKSTQLPRESSEANVGEATEVTGKERTVEEVLCENLSDEKIPEAAQSSEIDAEKEFGAEPEDPRIETVTTGDVDGASINSISEPKRYSKIYVSAWKREDRPRNLRNFQRYSSEMERSNWSMYRFTSQDSREMDDVVTVAATPKASVVRIAESSETDSSDSNEDYSAGSAESHGEYPTSSSETEKVNKKPDDSVESLVKSKAERKHEAQVFDEADFIKMLSKAEKLPSASEESKDDFYDVKISLPSPAPEIILAAPNDMMFKTAENQNEDALYGVNISLPSPIPEIIEDSPSIAVCPRNVEKAGNIINNVFDNGNITRTSPDLELLEKTSELSSVSKKDEMENEYLFYDVDIALPSPIRATNSREEKVSHLTASKRPPPRIEFPEPPPLDAISSNNNSTTSLPEFSDRLQSNETAEAGHSSGKFFKSDSINLSTGAIKEDVKEAQLVKKRKDEFDLSKLINVSVETSPAEVSVDEIFVPRDSDAFTSASPRFDESKWQPRTLERHLPKDTVSSARSQPDSPKSTLPLCDISVEEIFSPPTTKHVTIEDYIQGKKVEGDKSSDRYELQAAHELEIIRDSEENSVAKLRDDVGEHERLQQALKDESVAVNEPKIRRGSFSHDLSGNKSTNRMISEPVIQFLEDEMNKAKRRKSSASERSSTLSGNCRVEHVLKHDEDLEFEAKQEVKTWRIDRVQRSSAKKKSISIEDSDEEKTQTVIPVHVHGTKDVSQAVVPAKPYPYELITVDVQVEHIEATGSKEGFSDEIAPATNIVIQGPFQDGSEQSSNNFYQTSLFYPSTSSSSMVHVKELSQSVSSMENYITSTSILLDKNKAQSESTDSSSPNVVFHYAGPSQGEKVETTRMDGESQRTRVIYTTKSQYDKASKELPDDKQEDRECLEIEMTSDFFAIRGDYRMLVHRSEPLGMLLSSLSIGTSYGPAALDFSLVPKLKRLIQTSLTNRSSSVPMALSSRGVSLMSVEDPANTNLAEAINDLYHISENPKGKINLCTAENRVCEEIIARRIAETSFTKEEASTLTRYASRGGLPQTKRLLCAYFGQELGVELPSEHCVLISSCTTAYDILTHLICDSDDVVLTSSPMYARIVNNVSDRNQCRVRDVPLDLLKPRLSVAAFEEVRASCAAEDEKVGMIVLVNPHNPLGTLWKQDEILALCEWAASNEVFVVVDEILASTIHSKASKSSFHSILSLRHLLRKPQGIAWMTSFSKDLGVPGLKCALMYVPSESIREGVRRLEMLSSVPILSQLMLNHWLADTEWMRSTMNLSRSRLSVHAAFLSAALEDISIPHIKPLAGICIFADFSKYLCPDEEVLWRRFSEAGVVLTMGKSTGCRKPGWFRVAFGVPLDELRIGVQRLYTALGITQKPPRQMDYPEKEPEEGPEWLVASVQASTKGTTISVSSNPATYSSTL